MASWKNKEPDEIPEAGDYADWRADLQNQGTWKMPQLNDAVGNQVNGRTWAEIRADLIDYCRAAPVGESTRRLIAANLLTNNIGYRRDEGGTIDRPHVLGLEILRLVSNAAFSGTLAIDLEFNLPLPSDAFNRLVIVGESSAVGLSTADALYDSNTQTWVWFDTGFQFVPGEAYKITVKRAATP